MYIKQLSVFVENKPGRLAEITANLGNNNIDIRALSISDTRDFGIFRLIVDRPDEAEKCLKAAGYTVSLTQVIAIGIEDQPGKLANAMQILFDHDISVDYAYAFLSKTEKPASIILRVSDNDAAAAALRGCGIKVLDNDDVINI